MKTTFSKLPKAKQRVLIAKDVIKQINSQGFKAKEGEFIIPPKGCVLSGSIQNKLNDGLKCGVCAKGGLFLSYIKRVNNFNFEQLPIRDDGTISTVGVELDTRPMEKLLKIFSRHQLSIIETAFEGSTYEWNEYITYYERDKLDVFYKKNKSANKRLIAICENIIKNKGTFVI